MKSKTYHDGRVDALRAAKAGLEALRRECQEPIARLAIGDAIEQIVALLAPALVDAKVSPRRRRV